MNTFGTKFRLTTFGESHGLAVGGIIDGCPSQVRLNMEAIRTDLARRRSGAPRQEEDEVEWLSGILDGVTLGTPIAFVIRNKNTRSEDYDHLADCYRPGHADYTYQQKYGIRDHNGGGRASARETVARVVAGAIAKQVIAPVAFEARPEETPSVIPENDSMGGVVKCTIKNVPAGIGEPLYRKLNAQLASAMMSIPSVIGFEMGAGFAAAKMKGSEYIDRWNNVDMFNDDNSKNISTYQHINTLTQTNHCGGVQGGISNGMPIEFRVAFHPVVSIPQPIECLKKNGTMKSIALGGRHDTWHVQRAAAVVEAMAALVLVDNMLS